MTPIRNHSKSPVLRLLASLAAAAFVSYSAQAQTTYYWDSNGSTAGFGNTNGTWAAPTTGSATQGWSTDSTGQTVPGTVTTSTDDLLNFGSATDSYIGTVTISGAVSAANITLGAATNGLVTLSGSGGTINMGTTAGSFTINNAAGILTTTAVIAGSNGFSLNGVPGSFFNISSASTVSGAVAINGGTLRLSGGGTATGSLANVTSYSIASGATLINNRTTTPNTFSNISGAGALQQTSTGGTMILNTANASFSGNTLLSRGTIQVGNDLALGTGGTFTMANASSSATTTISSSDATAHSIANTFGTFGGSSATYAFGTATTGNLTFTSTTPAALSATTGGRTFQIDNAQTEFDFGFTNGSGATSITKTGAGVMLLAGSSTFTGGLTVNAGTVSTAVSSGNFGAGNITLANTAGVTLTLQNNNSIANSAILTFGTNSNVNLNFSGIELLGGVTDSVSGLTLTPGTYDANALNTYFQVNSFGGVGQLSVVPEPSTWMMVIAGAGTLVGLQRYRRKS